MQTQKPLTKPTKQRKMLYDAPAHVRHKLLAAHLSKSLMASHDMKSFAVRSGDTVRVMRGDHRGLEGKITRVDLARYRVYVEGLTREKVDGTTVFLPVHPSKLMITRLDLDDKWRKKTLEARKERRRKPEEAGEKPEARPAEKPKEPIEMEKAAEEKSAPKKKAPRKRITRVRKKMPAKKVPEKTKAEAGETRKEEKPRPKRKVKRSPRKTAKKIEEGEQ